MKLSLPALLRRSALAASLSLSALAADAAELVMVEQEGCMYCARWDAEIAPAYPKTEAGAYAPLVRRNIRDGAPEGSSYARKVVFTPTFILMEDGRELARIEGYPGEEFFWPVFEALLARETGFGTTEPTTGG